MNALKLVLANLGRGPITLRLPARVPAPVLYRGPVRMDPGKCQGCGMCAFACTSGGIVFRPQPAVYEWTYDPGRCTFCGRCVDGCASHALSMDADRAPIYRTEGALTVSLRIARKPPPRPVGGTP